MFGLLHATLQQNDCTNLRFLVTQWPWAKAKAIHTDIKMKSLVKSIILPNLKEIDFYKQPNASQS